MLKDIKILNISIEEDKKEAKRGKKPPKKDSTSSKKSKITKLGKTNAISTEAETKVEEPKVSETVEPETAIVQEPTEPVVESTETADITDNVEQPEAKEDKQENVEDTTNNAENLVCFPIFLCTCSQSRIDYNYLQLVYISSL